MEIVRCISCDGYGWFEEDGISEDCDWCGGIGYVYRDPNLGNYDTTLATYPGYQQVHGIKAAFSDFLKLRHGATGFLFGMQNNEPTDRPFRSLSYPAVQPWIMMGRQPPSS